MAKYSDNLRKKLSKLQKKILILAYRKMEEDELGEASISNREVMAEIYGFKPLKDIETSRSGSLIFDRKEIGINRYKSVSVSVVKSFNRLYSRGLAVRKYIGGVVYL